MAVKLFFLVRFWSVSVFLFVVLTRKRGFSFRTNFTHKANNLFRDKTHNTHTQTHTQQQQQQQQQKR